ncbi:MAG: hypothetical protein DRN25_01230 [Thermoplasmata archaeon]|nr:MAG: hypothetical protein DRN25_01230 [Thermoplasmata archaeon]
MILQTSKILNIRNTPLICGDAMDRELCPTCKGSGKVIEKKMSLIEKFLNGSARVKVCPTCDGSGWIIRGQS